jgi:hypothetical protein
VSRGIHDIDTHPFPIQGRILSEDRNASLLFQILVIHNPFRLSGRNGAGELKQAVNEGRFAMIDVGNDGNISDGLRGARIFSVHGKPPGGLLGAAHYRQGRAQRGRRIKKTFHDPKLGPGNALKWCARISLHLF